MIERLKRASYNAKDYKEETDIIKSKKARSDSS